MVDASVSHAFKLFDLNQYSRFSEMVANESQRIRLFVFLHPEISICILWNSHKNTGQTIFYRTFPLHSKNSDTDINGSEFLGTRNVAYKADISRKIYLFAAFKSQGMFFKRFHIQLQTPYFHTFTEPYESP